MASNNSAAYGTGADLGTASTRKRHTPGESATPGIAPPGPSSGDLKKEQRKVSRAQSWLTPFSPIRKDYPLRYAASAEIIL